MSDHRPRILVVDDDPSFRSLLLASLRSEYMVFVAADGQEGLEKGLGHVPDLAIIDVQMPVMDGLRLLREFRGRPQLARVPVMMLTGDASRQTVLAALESGANDYCIKPAFRKEDFLKKVVGLLNPQAAKPNQQANAPSPKPVTTPAAVQSANGPLGSPPVTREPVGVGAGTAASPMDNSASSAMNVQSMMDSWE